MRRFKIALPEQRRRLDTVRIFNVRNRRNAGKDKGSNAISNVDGKQIAVLERFFLGEKCVFLMFMNVTREREKSGGAFSPQKLTLIVYVYENEMTEKWVWKVQRYTYECNLFAADYAKPKWAGSLRPFAREYFLNNFQRRTVLDKHANILKTETAKFFWAC